MNSYTISVCGHVDHGKTELIKALTNKYTTHLPEEIERKMTIDLGYSFMENENSHIDFIDLPGHRDYIINALRGLSCADFFILVVDAKEKIKPQTIEAIEAIKSLKLTNGAIVINKIDLVGDNTDLIKDLSFYFPKIRIFKVSSITGEGINELKTYLFNYHYLKENDNFYIVDKSFSKNGIGKIITGTNKNHLFETNTEVTIYPQNESLYIKSIEANSHRYNSLDGYRRIAINFRCNSKIEPKRGNIISKKIPIISKIINIRIFTKLSKSNYEVSVICKGQKVNGKLVVFNNDYGQLRLKDELTFFHNFKIIVIDISSYKILTGGILIEPRESYHGKKDKYLKAIVSMENFINCGDNTSYYNNLHNNLMKYNKESISLKTLYYYSALENEAFDEFISYLKTKLSYDERKKEFIIKLATSKLYNEIETYYKKSDFFPPLTKDMYHKFNNKNTKKEIALLLKNNMIFPINEKYYIHGNCIKKSMEICKELIINKGYIDTKDFRDKTNSSRKISIMILEYLDKIKFTKNINNKRYL